MEKYNGWSNYITWKVMLELFDGLAIEEEITPEEVEEIAMEYLTTDVQNSLANAYIVDYLREVNWEEISEHLNDQ